MQVKMFFESCGRTVIISVLVVFLTMLVSYCFHHSTDVSAEPPVSAHDGTGGARPRLVVGVLSARHHRRQRDAIRATWWPSLRAAGARGVFVLGDSDCPLADPCRVDQYSCEARLPQLNADSSLQRSLRAGRGPAEQPAAVGFTFTVLRSVVARAAAVKSPHLPVDVILESADGQPAAVTSPAASSDVRSAPLSPLLVLPAGFLGRLRLRQPGRLSACRETEWPAPAELRVTALITADGRHVKPGLEPLCCPLALLYTGHEEPSAAAAGGRSEAAAVAGGRPESAAAAGGRSEAAAVAGDRSEAAAVAGGRSEAAAVAGDRSEAAAAGGRSEAAAVAGGRSEAAAVAGGRSEAAAPPDCRRADPEAVSRAVTEEAARHGDLLLVPGPDVYRRLPDKLLSFFHWAATETAADWVVKCDDDVLLDVPRILKHVPSDTGEGIWWGQFRYNWPPDRYGKWAELVYQADVYPPFACGTASLLSADVVRWLADNRQALTRFQGEDVSLGVWLAGHRVRRVPDPAWACGDGGGYSRGQLTPDTLRQTWRCLRRTGRLELCGLGREEELD